MRRRRRRLARNGSRRLATFAAAAVVVAGAVVFAADRARAPAPAPAAAGATHHPKGPPAPKVSKPPTTPPPSAPPSHTGVLPAAALLRVAGQDQWPQLPNGCEVTSLSMLLGAVGHPTSKLELAARMPRDPTPRVKKNGVIVSWGNPNVGFVGNVYVFVDGFGIYHGPITRLLDKVLPGQAVDLTGKPFDAALSAVASGRPVVLWTTSTFSPDVPFITWQSPEGPVHTTLDEHAVLLVGYDKEDLFVNNPENGERAEAVPRARFVAAWHVMGSQAVTTAGDAVPAADRCVGNIGACLAHLPGRAASAD